MKDLFTVRPAMLSDRDQILNLLPELGYGVSERDSVEIIYEQILSDPEMGILVIEDSSGIRGHLAYSIKPQLRLGGTQLEIDELIVTESRKGQGLGSKLVREVIAIAKLKDVKRIIVSTNRDRVSYQRGFYSKLGFQEKNSALFKLDLNQI